MMPSIIYETLENDLSLAGLLGTTVPIQKRIFELQSCDERPKVNNGYFIIIDMQDTPVRYRRFGPQNMQIWVHTPMMAGADYGMINKILNRIDNILIPLELVKGNDGVRLTLIEKRGRSKNLEDPGWKTATRNASYGVLYDEASA